MDEQVDFGQTLIKLKENNYDLSELSPIELEILQRYAPEIIGAASKLGEVGSKAQEKFYSIVDKAIDIFHEQLKDPNLSEEAREKLNDSIERMVELSFEKDTEFKKWLGALVWVGIGGGALALAGKNPAVRKAALNLLTRGKQI